MKRNLVLCFSAILIFAMAPLLVADEAVPTARVKKAGPGGGDSIGVFLKSQKTSLYRGKHITLQVQDRELSEIFQMLSEASEFNIIVSDNVKGKVELNLKDVPWDQALDLILHSYRLAAERQGNVLRITTQAALQAERLEELKARGNR